MRMINVQIVADKVGFSRGQIYKLTRVGKFPPGCKVGRAMRWPEHVIDGFIILYWGLNEPLPEMNEQTRAQIHDCVTRAKTDQT